VPKFLRTTPLNFKVIMAHLFHFEPIFDTPLKKVVKGAAVSDKGWASKTWSVSSACKNLGRSTPMGQNMFFQKMRFRWVRFHI